MAGTLYVVATPIGHLDDITIRALRILREVAVVAAEDTRRTGNLLRHFGISTRLISLHHHNEQARSASMVELLSTGQSIAVVTDAGTPGISDPGAALVRLARSRQIRVEPIPGASAVAAAISVAGLEDGAFVFLGFPPVKSNDRKLWLAKLTRVAPEAAVVFFEAPHRIRRTLQDLSFSVKQQIIVFRELTKIHEEILSGSAEELLERLDQPQGEFTVVIPPVAGSESAPQNVDKQQIINEFWQMTSSHPRSRREIAREVGKKLGLSTRQVYELTKDQPQ
jgi:16S rRNA (cytidine1402-2'-O)-methyltransferase